MFFAETIKKPLHIAIVTETFSPEINGVAHTLDILVSGLDKMGHRLSLIRPHQGKSEIHKYDKCIVTNYTKGFNIPGYPGLQLGFPHLQRINKWWKSDPPDVIYIATEGPLGYAALRVAKKLDIPALSGFHTNFHQYTSHYKFGVLKNLIFRYLKHFHNATKGTLVPDPELANKLCQQGIKPVHVMARGVDTKLFTPEKRDLQLRKKWGANNDDIVLLCVGRVAAEKNLTLAIRSFRVLQQHFSDIKMVIVGNGPLHKTLSRDNTDITFTGEIADNELAQHYASSDVFLFPSETETFGNVTLEAMASGLTVVAFDYAAAKTHIQHKHNGLVITPGNYDEFISTCLDIVKNRQLIKSIGSLAREYSYNLGWHHIVRQFENLLLQQINQPLLTDPAATSEYCYTRNNSA